MHQKNTIDRFTQKRMRQIIIIQKTWYSKRKTNPKQNEMESYQQTSTYKVYERTKQPTATSWIAKQSTNAMFRQTDPSRKIHLQTQTRMNQIRDKWEETWKQPRGMLLKNSTQPQTKLTTGKTTAPQKTAFLKMTTRMGKSGTNKPK